MYIDKIRSRHVSDVMHHIYHKNLGHEDVASWSPLTLAAG